jgi:shikimate 5-dehydrogenase
MASLSTLAAISRSLTNQLDLSAIGEQCFAAVIGDSPSQYSRSPRLWNAAFKHAGIGAVYFPFDIEATRLEYLLGALADCDRFLGASVTVP